MKKNIVYRFKQSAWLAKYIDHYNQKRTTAKPNFENLLYKVLNNAFFYETLENVRYQI